MNTRRRLVLTAVLALLGGVALVGMSLAAPGNAPLAGGAPTVVAYQGEVRVSGTPYDGDGYFKFALVDQGGTTSYWSNDGTSSGGGPPTAAVPLAVSEGWFHVLLGGTSLSGMTQPLTADVFSDANRYLRVWFSSDNITFEPLAPDTPIAAVPYALQAQQAADAGTVDGYEGADLEESAEIDADITTHTAISDAHHIRYSAAEAWTAILANDGAGSGLDADTVDGLHASELAAGYQNVIVVAQSGAAFDSVQAAIDSITDAANINPYLVWIAPGVYEEQVTMKPHVHVQGAGQEATIIISDASSSAWPPDEATLVLANETSLRDLTVANRGEGDVNVALLATAGMRRTLVANVTARSDQHGVSNNAILLTGSDTGVTVQQVTALAENGNVFNIGLYNMDTAVAVLRGGIFTGRGGEYSRGVSNVGAGTRLEAENVTALGENASELNTGLHNQVHAVAVVRGGVFTGRGGNQTGGVSNVLTSTMTAEGITVLAENGDGNYGLGNYHGATMTVRGAAVVARGGTNNYALSNEFNVTMDAEGVTSLAEGGSSANHGLWNVSHAQMMVRGGSFTGRGGIEAYGIYNADSSTTLDAESVTALAEDGSDASVGLASYSGAAATLRGGSFTGRRGTDAYGIYNADSGTRLEAESVSALAQDGSLANEGLVNESGAVASLHGGSFTGRTGQTTRGIHNAGSGSALEAAGVSALAENASSQNHGLTNTGVRATLRAGSFIGRGGASAIGVFNATTLESESITALGENGTGSYGLYNINGAATLRGGSFTGRGGGNSHGMYNVYSGSTLEAASVTALGENASYENYGLRSVGGAVARLHGGSFSGRGGTTARGIHGSDSGTTLEAERVTALGDDGSIFNHGLYNLNSATANIAQSVLHGATGSVHHDGSGSVTVSNSRLVGNAVSGTVTCVAVSRVGTFNANGCP